MIPVISGGAYVQFVFPQIVCYCGREVIQLFFVFPCFPRKVIIRLGFIIFSAVPPCSTVFPALFKIKLSGQRKTAKGFYAFGMKTRCCLPVCFLRTPEAALLA